MKLVLKIISPLIFLQLVFCSQEIKAQNKDSIINEQSKIPGVNIIFILNEKYRVWTKKSGNGKIKLLLLHGGPGSSPEYFENFPENLGNDYTIYNYAQLGTYFSDEPENMALANVMSAMEQVEEVRKGLGLDSFYLLGHSWGSFLAMVYASKYQSHVKGVIFSNTSIYAMGEQVYQGKLIADIVENKITGYARYADSIRMGVLNNFTNPVLMGEILAKVMPVFLSEHLCRVNPLPEPVSRSRMHSMVLKNPYNEYLNGDMLSFNFEPYLKRISVPALLIGSTYDYLPPGDYEKMKAVIGSKISKVFICPNGSHLAMWDDSTNYFRELNGFIKQVEQ